MTLYNPAILPTQSDYALLQKVESLLVFSYVLYRKVSGSMTVVEVSGGQPIVACDESFFRATDDKQYMAGRFRVPIVDSYLDNGKAIWQSVLDANLGSIPANFGGV